ncbi:class II fructose-bisphosphate aldolase [Pectinatus haikarae]|uniref:Ketose-bisphosphate aldolase n=1 Tax=Pectinatus haikarae TaxID=349096 RepID=A0ABT9YDF4_9FIRM|nr:class II fructose-bisphosphate aldolase [Pectinatus haikarae]MDQ0205064.1 ketose-bisphosphate aldolase [Pectinatus haikarae]
MLVSTKEMLQEAKKRGFAIPSANFVDQLSVRTHIRTAQKLGLPLILSYAQAHSIYLDIEEAALLGKLYIKKASVPVALHLDHGMDLAFIERAVELGFTSVMIDASMHDLAGNIEITKKVVMFAHRHNITVEAEIGHVGTGINVGQGETDLGDNSIYTTVNEAKKIAEQSGLDSLAVSIGTAHGLYKGTPKINFARLGELAEHIDVPLVLHGGSSSGYENLEKCALGGIAKINIYTDFIVNAYTRLRQNLPENYFEVRDSIEQGMADTLEHYYKVFHTQKI